MASRLLQMSSRSVIVSRYHADPWLGWAHSGLRQAMFLTCPTHDSVKVKVGKAL